MSRIVGPDRAATGAVTRRDASKDVRTRVIGGLRIERRVRTKLRRLLSKSRESVLKEP
jgi:hypothetical protein